MRTVLLRHEEMLLALVRAALTKGKADAHIFEDVLPEQWDRCFDLAVSQGVRSIAFDGVITLPERLHPYEKLYLRWALSVADYERMYERYCSTLAEVTNFYAGHGIATLHMKGVGFSTYYPVPKHREGGDIDIYTRSADKSHMTDAEANALADELMRQKGIDVVRTTYKHSVFHYNDIPFENHKCYLNVETMKISAIVEKELMKTDFPVRVSLADGKYEVNIPGDAFNTMFISVHAMQHAGSGLCLHHLCDWACLLNKCGLQLPEGLTDKSFLRALSMLNTFVSRFLGCRQYSACTEEELDMFFNIVMRPVTKKDITGGNPLKILRQKYECLLRHARIRKFMFGEPVAPRIIASAVSHLLRPWTLFITN